MSAIMETADYYWVNASWGVPSFKGMFSHADEAMD